MKKIAFSVLFFSVLLPLSAQNNYSREFGQVTAAEMAESEKLASKDPDAVVIHNTGKYWFASESLYKRPYTFFYREVVRKIKILSSAGLQYSTYEIDIYTNEPGDADIVSIEGYIYNMRPDGTLERTALTNENIVDEKMSGILYRKKIAFPNVKEGSIIELRYRQRTRFFSVPNWAFQEDIPVLYSELKYSAITNSTISYILKGARNLDVNQRVTSSQFHDHDMYKKTQRDEIVYTMGMQNLIAFKDTEFLPNLSEYVVALYFQSGNVNDLRGGSGNGYGITTWSKTATQFNNDVDFGKYLKTARKLSKQILPNITLEGLNEIDKIKSISEYVKSMYDWNGYRSKYASKKVSDLLKYKTGNNADLNLLLIGLLQGAGIDAIPVIIITSDVGKVDKKYPFTIFFNYVVGMVTVDGKNYFLDATDPFARFDELPRWCVDVEGLAVIPKTEKWVVLLQPQTSLKDIQIAIELDPGKGTAYVSAHKSLSGYPATVNRKAFNNSEDNLRKINKLNDNATLNDVSAENYADAYKPFVMNSSYEIPMETIDGKIFLSPLAGFAPDDNPFNQKLRSWPVYLYYKSMDSYRVVINIPEGYEVEHLPEAKSVDNNIGTTLYNIEENNGTISIQASFLLKKAEYAAMEYNSLKNTYGDMISTFSENIILRKKAGI